MIIIVELNDVIHYKIVDVLLHRFNIPETLLIPELWDEPLTGSIFQFSGVDFVYLFFELEKAFDIRISNTFLKEYGFSTVNKIAYAIGVQSVI
ncbi:hypothetical protein [Clostridium sp. Marseille-P299]|uniref:hypothetical protein n=1 Tax=Clostridium sp. Marseille-P299 TaxID=1805477 RepID=UPI00082DB2F4|nr:hypothetical protein [Clostridium sp. Marseille-P299]